MTESVSSEYLHPFPTVLEMYGFTVEATAELKPLLFDNIKQPSFISRAVANGGSSVVSEPARASFLKSLLIALPVGAVFNLTASTSLASSSLFFTLDELSPCCLRVYRSSECSSCGSAVENHTPPEKFRFSFLEDGSDRALTADLIERTIMQGLDRPEINTFSAMLMAAEIAALFMEVIAYDELVHTRSLAL